MTVGVISLIILFGLIGLIAIGVPLGFASGFLGAVIVMIKIGPNGLGILLARMYSLTITYSFLSVPLFIFMASLLERSNIARDLYDALNAWLKKTRGGVAVVTAIMATILAAMSGIIGGEIVLLGLIALPQMLRLKYNQDLAIGVICASGSLGTMIPPSIVLIIYGLSTSTSITLLFKEAFVPGLILSGLIIAYIIIRTRLQPHLAPINEDEEGLTLMEKIKYIPGFLPPVAIAVVVLGSIYGGITGITEAAAMGCLATLFFILIRKELTWFLFKDAVTRTFKATGTIITITFGATVLAGAYSLVGGPTYVANSILGLDVPPMVVIFIMQLIFLVLGAFMDWVGIVLLTMPVFMPIVIKLGFDPVWFGILFCVNMQVSFLSPPFGPAAFYLKSVAPPHITLVDIFRAFGPFIILQLIVLIMIMFYPEIVQNFHTFKNINH
ncbi:MAG: TRAP transporter large permease subunit [Pelagibacteraceae bacterium]|jgi:tripartite ATP-independent transporter DctM subunit